MRSLLVILVSAFLLAGCGEEEAKTQSQEYDFVIVTHMGDFAISIDCDFPKRQEIGRVRRRGIWADEAEALVMVALMAKADQIRDNKCSNP